MSELVIPPINPEEGSTGHIDQETGVLGRLLVSPLATCFITYTISLRRSHW